MIDIEEGTTVGTLLERLNPPENKPKMIFINGIKIGEETVLKAEDRAGIFPLVAGG